MYKVTCALQQDNFLLQNNVFVFAGKEERRFLFVVFGLLFVQFGEPIY